MSAAPAVPLIANGAQGQWVAWPGGPGVVKVVGTINGATLTMQGQGTDPAQTPIPMDQGTDTYCTFTTLPAKGQFIWPAGNIRLFASGAVPSGLYAEATPMQAS